MEKARRIKITHIHKEDAFYPSKDELIGTTGVFTLRKPYKLRGYYSGYFIPDSEYKCDGLYFLGIRYRKTEELKDEN